MKDQDPRSSDEVFCREFNESEIEGNEKARTNDIPGGTNSSHHSSTKALEDEHNLQPSSSGNVSQTEVFNRPLGNTEKNWSAAVAGGTGNTVIGVLFREVMDTEKLQRSVQFVQNLHPRTKSLLIHKNGLDFLEVADEPYVKVKTVNGWVAPPDSEDEAEPGHSPRKEDSEDCLTEAAGRDCFEIGRTTSSDLSDVNVLEAIEGTYKLSMCQQRWLRIVEEEMNVPWNYELAKESDVPLQLFDVKLYLLDSGRSLVMIRAHTAICDRVSAGIIVGDLLASLEFEVCGKPIDGLREGRERNHCNLLCVEDFIPKKSLHKPFWARGIDLVGYGLGSRRHACLHFKNTEFPRKTSLIRSGLSRKDTDCLLEAAVKRQTSLYGAISAAALKAAAANKHLENKFEHFAVTTMLDCRPLLEPMLDQSIVGFYHSAMMNTHHVGEKTDFWDLARRCHDSVQNAIHHHKHFTDMNDLNLLMSQAIQHPNLTPSSSLRTSMLCAFRDSAREDMKVFSESLGVEDYIGCSSVHGVGPCFAIFDSIREDGLHMANVYPAPLFSRSQMTALVKSMMKFLKGAIEDSRSS